MNKIITFAVLLVLLKASAQQEIKSKDSWFKAGFNIGIPTGEIASATTHTLGLDVRGQYNINPHIGIGITIGYDRYFEKNGGEGFGQIFGAGFGRYFFKDNNTFFAGCDLGYAGFVSAPTELGDSGFYLSPQVGYRMHHWNFYGYFKNVSAQSNVSFQSLGIGTEYNF